MKKRGKVLRDPVAGPGLLMVEGIQYPFVLEGVWRSEAPPRIGLAVDVEFDTEGKITSIAAVPDSQIAKEQAEVALAAAKQKGGAIAASLVARFGLPNLIAIGLLIIGWFFLSAVSIESPFGKLSFTFWQVLGFLNSSNMLEAFGQGRGGPSAGFYGFLAIVSLAGPFVPYFWKDKRAALGGLLPLLFMVMVGLMVRSSINSALGPDTGDMGGMFRQMREEAMKAISVGMGVYLSVLVSLYFAGTGLKQFLLAKAADTVVQASPKAA